MTWTEHFQAILARYAARGYAFKNPRKNQSAPVFPYVGSVSGHQELRTCAAIINVFHLIPAASQKMIEPLTSLMLKGERELLIEVGVGSRRRPILVISGPRRLPEWSIGADRVRNCLKSNPGKFEMFRILMPVLCIIPTRESSDVSQLC